MRVAIDVSPLYSGHFLQHRVRGTGYYLTNLLKSLRKYTPENEYIEFKQGDKPNANVTHYPYFEPFFLTLPPHTNGKSVVTVHDLTPIVFPDKFPAGLRGSFKWRIQMSRLRKAGAIITDSQSSESDILKFTGVDKSKIQSIYLAAGDNFKPSTEIEKKKIRDKYNLPEKFALYVGDVTWNKNLPGLVKAFIDLNLPLVIVGKAFANKEFNKSNSWNQDLARAQELSKGKNNIKSVGFVPDEDLPAFYSSATVFVMPSFYEGFGLPLLEAMQCGCPTISSNKGSLGEVAGGSSLIVDPSDVLSITNAVEKVWKDPELRRKLTEDGLDRAKTFSWEKTAKQTAQVYEQIYKNASA